MTKPAECINGCPENQVCDHCQNNWIDLLTLQDVAKAQADDWEIETYQCGWEPWPETGWGKSSSYRGRPRQPRMKEVKMECWLCATHLSWRTENASILRDWIRQPHLDLVAKVPCEGD